MVSLVPLNVATRRPLLQVNFSSPTEALCLRRDSETLQTLGASETPALQQMQGPCRNLTDLPSRRQRHKKVPNNIVGPPSMATDSTPSVSKSKPSQKRRPLANEYLPPSVPEVVRVQRFLHNEIGKSDMNENSEEWTNGHVVRTYIDLVSRESRIIIRYADGQEEDLCEGAVHRPYHRRPCTKRTTEKGPRQRNITSTTDLNDLGDPFLSWKAFAAVHTDSYDDSYSSHSLSSSADNSDTDLEETLSGIFLDHESLSKQSRELCNPQQSEDVDSEATLSDCNANYELAPIQCRRESGHHIQVTDNNGGLQANFSRTMASLGIPLTQAMGQVRGVLRTRGPISTNEHGGIDRENRQKKRSSSASKPPTRKEVASLKSKGKKRTIASRDDRGVCNGKGVESTKNRDKQIDPLELEFAASTWTQECNTYGEQPLAFIGNEPGCNHPYGRLRSCIGLFEQFWSKSAQRRIIKETNRHASIVDEAGNMLGGVGWTPITFDEFRAYLAIGLYMGMKRLPSTRMYWCRNEPLLHCPIISELMTRERCEAITRCLRVTNVEVDRSNSNYDKLHKVRWLMEAFIQRCKAMWNLNQQVTVDEKMVRYKGKYCPIRQYMPNKPCKFGIKVWALADSMSKYVWNFQIYCGKNRGLTDIIDAESDSKKNDFVEDGNESSGKGVGLQGKHVVKELMKDLHYRGDIVTMDNYFTSVPLFLDLLDHGIMATGTLRSNRKYVPKSMFAKSVTNKQKLGWLDWRMHESRKISCAVWKDKKAVLLLSTHVEPEPRPGEIIRVKRRDKGVLKNVPSGPMHLQYTRNMRGVDTADQLRGVYSCLTRNHKWWHRVFHFLLDTAVKNAWIIHCDLSFRFYKEPITHFMFQMQLAKELGAKWGARKLCLLTFSQNIPTPHDQLHVKERKLCRICKERRTDYICPGCSNYHICKTPCYWESHWKA